MALKANKILFFIFKLTVSSILLYVVLSKTGLEQVFIILRDINIFAFISAIFLYILAQFLSTIRWKLLLPRIFKMRKLFSLYMIGAFFNTLLPGIIGGDAVKAFYLYQATRKSSLALSSIFMDRYIGFAVLIAMGAVAYPFGYRYLQNSKITFLLPIVVLFFIAISFIIFGLRLGKKTRMLSDFYDYSHSYWNQKQVIVKAVILSILIQFAGILAVYCLTIGIGLHIPFIIYMIFLPLIILFTALPISISGIGVREGAFVLFFGLIGIKPEIAAAISLSWFITITAGSLIGIVEYIKYKREQVNIVVE